MASRFQGVWVSYKAENLDRFLKALGSSLIVRGLSKTLSTIYDIQYLGDDTFKIKVTNGPKTRLVEFKLGDVVEEHNPAGESFKGTWVMEEDKMVGNFKLANSGKDLQIIRDIVNGDLVQKMRTGNVSADRYFKKK